ncbi:hypothetical protein G647_04475 [Cladophialophora carrionii CBS 160.54]|uniref:DUF7908 domain-containing protein n=1 Tax=Cladophialophora carrionii CBS 160.54 TaxID=1279043 RepID=V9DDX0_9EURO|nr:uncharacterized protein G647_04475 [Cladophialophora carrionii CBS 160.54]ETI25104.1 hypothetical protein G647_04475 [Cladophialophora carrionii CBS 160.54]
MWPSSSLLLPYLAAHIASVSAQALSTVTYGPSGPCPVPSVTSVVVVQPGYYSSFFQSASSIVNLWGNGNTVMINNAPTTYITNTYISTTIISTITTTVVNPSTTAASSSGADVGPILTGGSSSTTPATSVSMTPMPPSSSISLGPSSTSSPIFTPVPPPETTPAPAPVLTSTSVDANGNTVLVRVTQTPLALGEGLPSGTITDLPASLAENGIIVGVAVNGLGAKVKRQAPAGPTAGAVLSGDEGGAALACDVAVRYFLERGQLTDGTDVVGRNTTDNSALMTPDPDFNNVTTVLSFVDGILNWNSADRGAATFYQCGDAKVYAGFPNPPKEDCYIVTLGGIAATACPVPLRDEVDTSTSTDIPSSTPASSDVSSTTAIDVTTTTDSGGTGQTTTPEPGSSTDQTSPSASPSSSEALPVSSTVEQTTPPVVATPTSAGTSVASATGGSVVASSSSSSSVVVPPSSSSPAIPQSSSAAATIGQSTSSPGAVAQSSSSSVVPAQSSSSAIVPVLSSSSSASSLRSSSTAVVPAQSSTTAVTSTASWIKHYTRDHPKYQPGYLSPASVKHSSEQPRLKYFSRYSVFLSFPVHFCPHCNHNISVPKQQLGRTTHIVLGNGGWKLVNYHCWPFNHGGRNLPDCKPGGIQLH